MKSSQIPKFLGSEAAVSSPVGENVQPIRIALMGPVNAQMDLLEIKMESA